jgi:gluconolactonase
MWRALCFVVAALSAFAQHVSEEGRIEKLSGGHQYASSVAWSREGYLLIADPPASRITRIDDKGRSVFRDNLAAVGLAFDEEGRLYACEKGQKHVIRVDKKNKTDVLAATWEGKRFNGPSDVVVLKKDHVYFTDPAFASADAQKELASYGIYHIGPKGEIAAIASLRARPNGIAISHDGKTLYATVADERTILAWTLDKNGAASEQRVFADNIEGVPDGLDVSPDGRVFVAARELLIYSPEGKVLLSQPVAEKPVDVALGESDWNTLFIAAGSSVYRFRLPPELQSKQGGRH